MPHSGRQMRYRSGLAAIVLALAGCAGPVPSVTPTIGPTVAPTTSVTPEPTTPSPSPDLGRPDPGPDAPAIAEPYWLGVGSPGSSTITDADGNITRQLREMSYQIVEGGRVEDETIIIDGRIVGSVSWTVVEVDDGNDPMMEQVEAFNGEAEQVTIDGIEVHYQRYPEASYYAAYWWEPGHERYFTVVVSEAADLEPVTEALIRP